ncbi:hypothetical protein D9613_000189 [Agrocybe pediades]|uniref:Uncharacterized protein n=1 Tax=Agrocybe pediades TaxID=84607 RepID=A0A8H4R0D7_9AGAR|nr:hypothetical protein D9613_000189 [Agrocybe pediades]
MLKNTVSFPSVHAYNTHLSPSRARASRRNRASTVDAEQPQAQSQMLPTSAFPPSATPTTFASLSPQLYPQQSPLLGDPRPALIQIEPPPPPRMRRKRVDAGLGNAIETSLAYPGSASNSTGSSHSHEEFGGQNHGRRSYSGDAPYTYPYSHSRTTSRQYREPIVLAYQPPKVRTPDDASLFEMTEPEEKGLESEGANAKETDSDLELNLEVEMQKALTLSRSSSVATSRSGVSSRRGHARAAGERKRASASIHAAASRRMSASFQVTTATSKAKAKAGSVRNSKMLIDLPHVSHERNSYVMSQKKKPTTSKEDDPATYIRKRGSIQSAVPPTKKLFGWEFGWDPLPLSSRGARSKSATRSQDADESFIAGEDVVRQPTRARKLKKRSKSTLRSANEETFSMPQVADYPLPLPKRTSLPGSEMESPPSSASFNTFGIRRHHARSSSRPGAAESKKSSFESDEALSCNGHVHHHQPQQRPVLNLKRSFKMGIGRTLGPSLSLASVDDGRHQPGRVERRKEKGETSPSPNEEDLEDVDSEIRSIAAAKLVSASIARVTPAATIVAAPASAARITTPPTSTEITGSAAPVNIKHPALMSTPRPVLPAIVTVPTVPFPKSAPATMKAFSIGRSPSSAKPPRTGGSTWRPHPFAESPAKSPMHGSVTAAYLNDVGALSSPEDDVVSLEREMEEIRGSRSGGQSKMDSPTTQFKELAMLMSIPMPESTTLPKPIPSSRKSKGGALEAQKSSPIPSQDDYPYRFPMFFPGSNSNSPPKVQPTSATPRGPGSGLRLSAKTMDTVRNAFAGVRLSMRASMHSTAAGSTKGTASVGEKITEDRYGDFMDLCDPFASPPMSASTIAISPVVRKKTSRHGSVARDGGSKVDEAISEEAEEQVERKMSAWGRLPMPARSNSPGPSSKRPSSGGRVAVRAVGKPSRKHKKDKRSRKSTLPGLTPKPPLNALEDADFGFEEAVLSQRLLSRLDAHGWESRV